MDMHVTQLCGKETRVVQDIPLTFYYTALLRYCAFRCILYCLAARASTCICSLWSHKMKDIARNSPTCMGAWCDARVLGTIVGGAAVNV